MARTVRSESTVDTKLDNEDSADKSVRQVQSRRKNLPPEVQRRIQLRALRFAYPEFLPDPEPKTRNHLVLI